VLFNHVSVFLRYPKCVLREKHAFKFSVTSQKMRKNIRGT